MTSVIFRSLLVFLMVLVIIRLMGKRQIGDMQPFELAVTLVIADLACIPMSDVSIPLVYGLVAMLSVFAIHMLITFLNRKNLKLRSLFSGTPTILIDKNGLKFDALIKQNMTISDVLEAMRDKGVFDISEIAYAVLETNGQLSILRKKENSTNAMPLTLIYAGKFDMTTLKMLDIDKEFILDILKNDNITDVKSILIFTIDNDGNVYYQQKFKPYVTKKIQWNGGDKW